MISSTCSPTKNPLIIGYTTRLHLLLDLDNITLSKAQRIAEKIIHEWPEVGDCLIMLSSSSIHDHELRYSWNNWPYFKNKGSNFHLIFNNIIGYNKACMICETLAGLGVLQKDYLKIRTFRGDMTLRVSESDLSTGVKSAPVKVDYIRNELMPWSDHKIRDYLAFRAAVLQIFGKTILTPTRVPSIVTNGKMIH